MLCNAVEAAGLFEDDDSWATVLDEKTDRREQG
jgi:hypothetical protein